MSLPGLERVPLFSKVWKLFSADHPTGAQSANAVNIAAVARNPTTYIFWSDIFYLLLLANISVNRDSKTLLYIFSGEHRAKNQGAATVSLPSLIQCPMPF